MRKDVVVAEKSAIISSRNYQKLVAKIEGKPEERILSLPDAAIAEAGALQHR